MASQENDHRVRDTLVPGMRDLQNLLVHLQMVLQRMEVPVVRAGGGLTFSGFSIQAEPGAPVDWVGYHIDRPEFLVYQIQDRILPEECPLSQVKRLQARRYERVLNLAEVSFFSGNEQEQMDLIASFLGETLEFLRSLPPEDPDQVDPPFIPVIDRT